MTSQLYTEEWHAWHSKSYNRWSERALFGVFAHLGLPRRMLDVGCADGHLVHLAASLGVVAFGCDIAAKDEVIGSGETIRHDLTQPLPHWKLYDLVVSWEVAEHLPAESADTFSDTLAKALEVGGHLVFTAAIPGQGGHGHVNEQPHGYWRAKLEARGLAYMANKTEDIRATWKATTGSAWWYPQNIQVFSR